jgi:hypothetical protein
LSNDLSPVVLGVICSILVFCRPSKTGIGLADDEANDAEFFNEVIRDG